MREGTRVNKYSLPKIILMIKFKFKDIKILIKKTKNKVILHNLAVKYLGSLLSFDALNLGNNKVPIVSGINLIISENNKETDNKPSSEKLENDATKNIVPLLFINPIRFWIQFFKPKDNCFFNKNRFKLIFFKCIFDKNK